MSTYRTSISRVILSAAALMLLGAGCVSAKPVAPPPAGGPTPSAAAPAAAPTPATTPPTATKPAPTGTKSAPKTVTIIPKTETVTIQNSAFSPQVIAVNAGDTVTWVNKDSVSHTTVSDNALIWDSGNLAPGQKYSRVFKYVGSYKFHCGIHPSMTGTVVVR